MNTFEEVNELPCTEKELIFKDLDIGRWFRFKITPLVLCVKTRERSYFDTTHNSFQSNTEWFDEPVDMVTPKLKEVAFSMPTTPPLPKKVY